MAKASRDGIQVFVREQLEEAQRRFSAFEADAEKALKHLVERGQRQRKELEHLVGRLNGEPLWERPAVRQLTKRAGRAGTEVRKRIDHLQSRVIAASGVASQAQVREISRELSRLSKKLDGLLGKKSRPTANA